MVLHCIDILYSIYTFFPFSSPLMVNAGRRGADSNHVSASAMRLSLHRLLRSIMQRERERKRASSLLRMTHRDTLEQKTKEDEKE